jgi:hypothetical protein
VAHFGGKLPKEQKFYFSNYLIYMPPGNPPYAQLPEPGTYHIASLATDANVIEVLDYNQNRLACSEWKNKPNQQVRFDEMK